MKALFCHDHYYYFDGEQATLSKGQYPASVWSRYLEHFEQLTVLGRDGGTVNMSDKNINIASRDNVSFHLFQNTNSIKGLLSGRHELRAKIADLVSNHDVIILRGISEIGTIAFHEARKQNKFIALEMVSCAWDELWYNGSILAKLYAPYRFLLARFITKKSNAVIYVSQTFLQSRYPTKAPLIAKASNVEIPDAAFHKSEHTTSKAPFKICMIGTLKNKLKGVHIAIEAMRLLNRDDVSLHILGPGDPAPFQKTVENLPVVFDGIKKSGSDVWNWLRTFDLYIQPSFQEGVPRAMIEAMAQGLPAIGSDAGGIPELIDHDMIVKRGDAQMLADKINMMINDTNLRSRQSSQNFEISKKYAHGKLSKIRFEFWSNVKIMADFQQS